ncbi:MAG: N-acetylmuramoyl-L-alanine amidase [Ruminococcaceae bacterium]|nr:N-acetylmuramoyl-L-alanine amidase [Oscillospiraceae bacterium]
MRFIKYFLAILLAAVLLALPAAADIEKNGKVVIVIDPGHGGVDGGSDKGTVPEKVYNMKLSEYLRDALEATGLFEVYMTRETDVYLKYLPRIMVAKEAGADLVISMHCNTVYENWVRGSSAYVSLIEDYCADDVANLLLDYLGEAVSIPRGQVYTRADTGDSLGVYYWDYEKQWDMPGAWWLGKVSDYYSISTWSSKFGIPSVIIEHGYLTNWSDLAVLDNDDDLRKMAQAEADALVAYYTGHYHEFGEYEVDFPSNCTFVGTESRRCTICGARSGIRPLPASPDNHFWRQTGSAQVSCESDGYVSYVCQIAYNANDKGYPCDVHTYFTNEKSPGHDYNVLEDSEPTHDKDGLLHKVCRTCGHEIREVRAGEGHNWELAESVAPTCEADGADNYICSVCGETKTEVLTTSGHEFDIVSDTQATHTEDGFFKQICKICGKEESEVRAAEGHSFTEIVAETLPTCTEDGKRASKCTVCGEIIDEVLPATGHTEVYSEDGRERSCATCGRILYTAPLKFYENPAFYAVIVAILIVSGVAIAFFAIRNRRVYIEEEVDVLIAKPDEEENEEEAEEVEEELDDDEEYPEEEPTAVEREEIPYEYDEETCTPDGEEDFEAEEAKTEE